MRQDPSIPIPTSGTTNWVTAHLPMLGAAIILTFVAVALYRAAPKWLFAIVLLVAVLILTGVKLK